MKTVILSHRIDNNTPTYGNRDKFILERKTSIENGDTANSYQMRFTTNHLGTHIDLPKHFFDNGKDINSYLPNDWIFENVQLLELPCENARLINETDISEKVNQETDMLIIRTGYEKYRGTDKYWNDNPGIAPGVGIYLRKNFSRLRCIGFDFISLTSWKYRIEGKTAHRNFLNPNSTGNPICIIEDMSLSKVNGKLKSLIVLPLFVFGMDSSPVSILAHLY